MRFRRILISAALAASVLLAGAASALEVVVGDVDLETSEVGQTHWLPVFLRLGPGETPPEIAGFQVAVDRGATSEVFFVSPFASPASGDPAPLIATNFTANFAGGNGAGRATALAFLDTGTVTVTEGAGLMRIPFQISGAVTEVQVTVDLDPVSGTVLAGGSAESIPFTPVAGTIRVDDAPPVPLSSPVGICFLLAGAVRVARTALRASEPFGAR